MSVHWLEAAKPMIENIWYKASPSASFYSKLKSISKVYKAFCQRKAQHFRAEEEPARSASTNLQAQSENPELQSQHGSARLHLQDVESKKVAGQCIRSRLRWKI